MLEPSAPAADTPERVIRQAFSSFRLATATGAARLMLVGELDLVTADLARKALRRAQDDTRELICDLRDVWFVDLSGLQVLVSAALHAKRSGGRLTVTNCPSIVPRMLRLLKLQDALDIQGALPSAPSHECAAIRAHVS